jgi:hypothetical protein
MSLELISAVASLTTAVVIGATAIAALIQLRHMRASNQITGFLTLRNMLDDDAHQRAVALLHREGDLSQDEGYRRFVADDAALKPTGDQKRYEETRAAVLMIANAVEVMGTLVRNGVVDERMFFEQYCGPIDGLWQRLEGHIALERGAHQDDAIWEDFEYLAARSRRFALEHRSVYPAGVPHLLPPQAKKSDRT